MTLHRSIHKCMKMQVSFLKKTTQKFTGSLPLFFPLTESYMTRSETQTFFPVKILSMPSVYHHSSHKAPLRASATLMKLSTFLYCCMIQSIAPTLQDSEQKTFERQV